MNCWRVQNLVAPFLDGELPDVECEALVAHLEVCGECTDMVTSVEALPPLTQPRLPKDMEESLFEHFDACLAERLAAGLPALDEHGPRSTGAAIAGLVRREIRVPAAFAAAWLGVMVMLAGGVALNHTKVQDLEDSVARREAIIQALQERVAIADARQNDSTGPGSDFRPVLMPAGAPSALGSTLPLRRGPYGQPGIIGASVRQASYDAPRVVR
jgi:anti-sigma factor RsiW